MKIFEFYRKSSSFTSQTTAGPRTLAQLKVRLWQTSRASLSVETLTYFASVTILQKSTHDQTEATIGAHSRLQFEEACTVDLHHILPMDGRPVEEILKTLNSGSMRLLEEHILCLSPTFFFLTQRAPTISKSVHRFGLVESTGRPRSS